METAESMRESSIATEDRKSVSESGSGTEEVTDMDMFSMTFHWTGEKLM